LRLSLRWKLSFIILTILAVVLIGVYFSLKNILTNQMIDRLRESVAERLEVVKPYVEVSTRQAVNTDEYHQIANSVEGFINAHTMILDTRGRVLGDSSLAYEHVQFVSNYLNLDEVKEAMTRGYGEHWRLSQEDGQGLLNVAMTFDHPAGQRILHMAFPISESTRLFFICARPWRWFF